jgi:hypothetical protein
MGAIEAADVPTLNQSTTGSAGSVANSITFNDLGAGAVSGTTYNGAIARTISYNSVGAPSVTGVDASGDWNINANTVTNGVYTTSFTDVQSLGVNGYQKFPGGLIIQWGSVTVTPSWPGTQAVTFSTPFTSGVYSITATPRDITVQAGNKRDSFSVQSITLNGFVMNSAFEDISSTTYYWLAIGV